MAGSVIVEMSLVPAKGNIVTKGRRDVEQSDESESTMGLDFVIDAHAVKGSSPVKLKPAAPQFRVLFIYQKKSETHSQVFSKSPVPPKRQK